MDRRFGAGDVPLPTDVIGAVNGGRAADRLYQLICLDADGDGKVTLPMRFRFVRCRGNKPARAGFDRPFLKPSTPPRLRTLRISRLAQAVCRSHPVPLAWKGIEQAVA